VRNLKKLFDVTDVVDDVQGVVDETMQRTTDNLHQVSDPGRWHILTLLAGMAGCIHLQACSGSTAEARQAGCLQCRVATCPVGL
jgi:hypothetical protein